MGRRQRPAVPVCGGALIGVPARPVVGNAARTATGLTGQPAHLPTHHPPITYSDAVQRLLKSWRPPLR